MLSFVIIALLAIPVLAWNDGVFTGVADGHNGPVTVEVTVEGGQISAIKIVEHSETPYLSDAGFGVTESIIAKQSTMVDAVSGATVTSEAVIAAVVDALLVADGTYTGTADGYNGELTVEIVVLNRQITEIKVVSHSETPYLSDAAFNTIPAQIIETQSTVVDVVSGATGTSKGIISAVNNAIQKQSL